MPTYGSFSNNTETGVYIEIVTRNKYTVNNMAIYKEYQYWVDVQGFEVAMYI